MTPSRRFEVLFYPKDDDPALLEERLHYENLKLLTDKQLDVIRYLYMRLNIIDGKAGYLLRINALTASVISVLISFSARAGGESIFTHISPCQAVLLILALIFIVSAFLVTFSIGELEYDHVTDPPDYFNQVPIGDVSGDYKLALPLPTKEGRRFVGKYSEEDVTTILRTVARHTATGTRRTFKAYEDEFFKITIARVKILHLARWLVLLGVISSMAFVIYFAASPPKDLVGTQSSHPQPTPSPTPSSSPSATTPGPTPSVQPGPLSPQPIPSTAVSPAPTPSIPTPTPTPSQSTRSPIAPPKPTP